MSDKEALGELVEEWREQGRLAKPDHGWGIYISLANELEKTLQEVQEQEVQEQEVQEQEVQEQEVQEQEVQEQEEREGKMVVDREDLIELIYQCRLSLGKGAKSFADYIEKKHLPKEPSV